MTPGTRLGPYEIVETIGVGGMGAVYRARDTRLGRDVAIKVSSSRFSDRFEREARTIAALSHTNICTLHDVGPDYLVMELVPGQTLAERISRGPIALEESLPIARQIADALQAAHERGIVHRDLKPANVKLTPDGHVKVLDFGLAKVAELEAADHVDSPTQAPPTRAGEVLGTAAYMAPEQARGDSVDKRADIWAFGVVVYEMVTGRRPFHGRTASDTIAAVLTTEPAWNDLPESMHRTVRRCLVKDPKRRLRDLGDLELLLEPAPTVVAPPSRRSWLAWAIAALLLAALGPVAVTHLRERPAVAESIRFQIPQTVPLAPSGNIGLSPDGRYLAFLGMGDDGRVRLYLRTMDSLEVRPLEGSEVAPHAPPFIWSPDSRFIAFDAGGVLKKLNIAGGPAQTLCELAAPAIGGSWNRQGDIILGNVTGGLLRVSENGGAVSPATVINPARKEDSHVLPTFLPDGRHFIYLRASRGTPSMSGTYIGSLDTAPEAQNTEPLMPYAVGMTYVPSPTAGPGRLLYVQEGNLIAHPFDAERRVIAGDAVPVAERVGVYLDGAAFSAARNMLVYRTSDPEFPIQWFDRQGQVASRVSTPGLFGGIALSPADTHVVAVVTNPRDSGNSDLWMFDLVRGGTPTRFTSLPMLRADFPVWSADGQRVAFRFPGPVGVSIHQKPVSGVQGPELLVRNDRGLITPTGWSPDGRFMIYASTEGATLWDLRVARVDGAERSEAKYAAFAPTRFNEEDGRFSPDGQWVAYVSNETGRDEVYVRRFNPDLTTGSASIGTSVLVSNGGGSSPRWRADGKELFFLAPGGMMMSSTVKLGPSFTAQRPVALFQTPRSVTFGGGTKDGQRFLLVERGAAPFTVVVNWR